MKRFFALCIFISIVFCSGAFAESQQFGKYSKTYSKFTVLNVPAGWEALDEESDTTATLRKIDDRNTFVSIYVDERGNRDIIDIANEYRNTLGGPDAFFLDVGEAQDFYSFRYVYSANVEAIAYVFGSNFNSYLPTSMYGLIKRSENVIDYDFRRVYYSLIFEADKGQEFSMFTTFNFPGNWNASENESTGEVTYVNRNDRNEHVTMLIAPKNRVTLRDIADDAIAEFDGNALNEFQGLYEFEYWREGTHYLAWIIDQNYITNIPSDYYCFAKCTINANSSVGTKDFYAIVFSTLFHPEGKSEPEPVTPTPAENIANYLGVDNSEVNVLAETGAPVEPTQAITTAVNDDGYEIVSTTGSVTPPTRGYTAFPVSIPASLTGLSASDVKIYLANRSGSAYAGDVFDSALPSGMTEAVIFNSEGRRVSVLPASVLACAQLNANEQYSIHAAKKKTESSNPDTKPVKSGGGGGGGCNTGAGLFASLFVGLSAMIFRKR